MPHFVDSRINENVEVATEYFKALVSQKDGNKVAAGSIGFIPFNMSFTMDGISGIKIYNELSVDTSFLPPGYTKTTDFIVTGVDHKIQNGDWETSITTTLIPRTSPINNIITSSLSFTSQTEEAQVDTAPSNPTSPPANATPQSGNSQQARANNTYVIPYGLNPLQTPADGSSSSYAALMKSLATPYPLIYSSTEIKNNQNLENTATKKNENVKMSDLTYDYSTKLWKDASGNTYKNKWTIIKPKVHKDVHDSLVTAFNQIKQAYGMEKIWDLGLNTSSGTYVPRYMRGNSGSLSMHTWGVAIDLLAGRNPLKGPNSKSPKAYFSQPEYSKFISIMEQNGWLSLGKHSNYDWMHFQTVTF
jgi:hypothetical protein